MNTLVVRGRGGERGEPTAFGYSLLPQEYATPRRVHPVALCVLGTVLLAVLGVAIAETTLHADASRSRLAALEVRRRAEAEEFGRLATVRKGLLGSVQPVVKEIAPHPPFSNVMISLSSSCGGSAWLIQADIDATKGTCRLHGEAADASAARAVVERLRKDPLFASASLEGMEQLDEEKGGDVRYEIVAELSGTPR